MSTPLEPLSEADEQRLAKDTIRRLNEQVILLRALTDHLHTLLPKRFFTFDDGGIDYTIVAADLEHAKHLLRTSGVEVMADVEDQDDPLYGLSVSIDHPYAASYEWIEITAERAKEIRVATGDDGAPPVIPLADCKVGDWFCSEF